MANGRLGLACWSRTNSDQAPGLQGNGVDGCVGLSGVFTWHPCPNRFCFSINFRSASSTGGFGDMEILVATSANPNQRILGADENYSYDIPSGRVGFEFMMPGFSSGRQ